MLSVLSNEKEGMLEKTCMQEFCFDLEICVCVALHARKNSVLCMFIPEFACHFATRFLFFLSYLILELDNKMDGGKRV